MKKNESKHKSFSEFDWLISEGVSVVPLDPHGNKKPIIAWKELQDRKPTREEITKWKQQTPNFAAVCGEVSNNLVIIDIDAEELFSKLNMGPLAAQTKVDKTPHGYHIWLRTEHAINNRQFPKTGKPEIEIKANNELVTIAGSKNKEGTGYEHFTTSPREIQTANKRTFDNLERLYNDYRGTGKKSFGELPKGTNLKGAGIQKIIQIYAGELKELTDHGEYSTCRCPFPNHEDKTPSFTIYPATNSYYCWSCCRGGNAINFLADFSGISQKRARERLETDGWLVCSGCF